MTELASVELVSRDTSTVVRIRGEIDLSNALELGEAIGAAAGNDAVVYVDLSETEYVDSAAIAMLFRLDEYLKNKRQELRLVIPPDSPVQVALKLTNIERVVKVIDALG